MKFETGIQHHLVDTLQDPNIPGADFIFGPGDRLPKRCGLPLVLVQGYRIFPREIEEHVYRLPHPKVCIARWLVDVGLQLGVPAQQLVHVPYGIDTLRYKLTRPLDQRPLQISMLYNEHPMKGSQHGSCARSSQTENPESQGRAVRRAAAECQYPRLGAVS